MTGTMIQQNRTCPWNVPVHIEPANFVPLVAEHARFNIRIASSAPYGVTHAELADDEILYADLQTSLSSHVIGRLGSGRSGFWGGQYLKGVGRTPLAANWNHKDHLHSTGHLSASSAIREYVVSLYLKSKGLGPSIVACDGLLLAKLAPALKGYTNVLYADCDSNDIPPVDRYLQAITIKSGDFARLSNFCWFLHHLTPGYIDRGSCSLAVFCELLASALSPADDQVVVTDITASGLVALLARRLELGWAHFRQWFAAGIWWGSFTNNFTVDGRFLDLETPAFLMGACFGSLSTACGRELGVDDLRSSIVGSELFVFIAHARAFCSELQRVLGNLARWFSPLEREFAAELASEVARQILSPDQPLGSRREAIAWVTGMLEEAFGRLTRADQLVTETLIDYLYERELGAPGQIDAPNLHFAAVPGSSAMLTEPGLRLRPFALRLGSGRLLGPTPHQAKASRALAEIIADLDHTTRLPQLLDKLSALSRLTSFG